MRILDISDKIKNNYLSIPDAEVLAIFNLIEQELALEYFPLYTEEEWKHYPKVYYKEYSKRPIRITSCENTTYQLHEQYIITKNKKPLGRVEYQYLPDEKIHITDLTEYDETFLYIYMYGIISEYCLQQGNYDEAYIWNMKYKTTIQEKIEKKGKNLTNGL